MPITYHGPVIFVKDITKSKDFYTKILDQVIRHDFGTNLLFESGLSLWQPADSHEIAEAHPYNKKDNSRFELYFESDELDKIKKLLEDTSVTYLHPIKEESWGQRTLRFYDPDNHLIEIGETLKTFVTRMAKEGMSEEQISEKSGIPVKDVLEIMGE